MTRSVGKYKTLKATTLGLAIMTAVSSTAVGGERKAAIQDDHGDSSPRVESGFTHEGLGHAGEQLEFKYPADNTQHIKERMQLGVPFSSKDIQNFKVIQGQTNPKEGKFAFIMNNGSGVTSSIFLNALGTGKDGKDYYAVGRADKIDRPDGSSVVHITKINVNGTSGEDFHASKNGTQEVLSNNKSNPNNDHLFFTQQQLNKTGMEAAKLAISLAPQVAQRYNNPNLGSSAGTQTMTIDAGKSGSSTRPETKRSAVIKDSYNP